MTSFNCLLIGDKNVGKSTFIHRMKTGRIGITPSHVTTLTFYTNHGSFTFTVYEGETSSKINCIINMYDITDLSTYHAVSTDLPMINCGNKCDKPYGRCITPGYEISAYSIYNWEKPFLYLLRKLVNEDLYFIEA